MAFKQLILYCMPDDVERLKGLIERLTVRLKPTDFELEIIDVSQQPERRVQDNISKVPTLSVIEGERRRDIQDFNDSYEISYALGLKSLW